MTEIESAEGYGRLGREIPAGIHMCAWSRHEFSSYEYRVRTLAQYQRLVVQKRRGRARSIDSRVYRLRHWATGQLLIDDTPPPEDESLEGFVPGEWLSIRHVHAVLLNLDVAGRIDRWWNQLTVAEQGCVLDNVEQLPERFVAELCAVGIGGATRGRLPDSVRNHLRRIGVRSEQLAAVGACLVRGGQEWRRGDHVGGSG